MSLFINELAFKDAGALSASLISAGKIGVFAASMIAAVIGLMFLKSTCRTVQNISEH
jgi:Na+/H+ antiporter NhaA